MSIQGGWKEVGPLICNSNEILIKVWLHLHNHIGFDRRIIGNTDSERYQEFFGKLDSIPVC